MVYFNDAALCTCTKRSRKKRADKKSHDGHNVGTTLRICLQQKPPPPRANTTARVHGPNYPMLAPVRRMAQSAAPQWAALACRRGYAVSSHASAGQTHAAAPACAVPHGG